jgi:phosphoenolpyruvate synthase/pyruvate phosphate dikinase
MAEALVKMGIESISLNPDTVLQTLSHISELESKYQRDAKA